MIAFKRITFALCLSFLGFIFTFAAIFVPMLLYDEHVAPHDGQGGIGGFLLGLPVAALAALGFGVGGYSWTVRHRWYEPSEVVKHSEE
jgi:hypothetical protein